MDAAADLLSDDAWGHIFLQCDLLSLLRLEACCALFQRLAHEPDQWELQRWVPDTFLLSANELHANISQRDVCLCALAARDKHKLRDMLDAMAAVPEARVEDWGERALALCSRLAPTAAVSVASHDDLCWIVEIRTHPSFDSDQRFDSTRAISYIARGYNIHHDGDRVFAIMLDDRSMSEAPFPCHPMTWSRSLGPSSQLYPNATINIWAVHIPSKNVALVHHGNDDNLVEEVDGGEYEDQNIGCFFASLSDFFRALPRPELLPEPFDPWTNCLSMDYKASPSMPYGPKGDALLAPSVSIVKNEWRPFYFALQLFSGRSTCGDMLDAISRQLIWARPRGLSAPRDDPTDSAVCAAYIALARDQDSDSD